MALRLNFFEISCATEVLPPPHADFQARYSYGSLWLLGGLLNRPFRTSRLGCELSTLMVQTQVGSDARFDRRRHVRLDVHCGFLYGFLRKKPFCGRHFSPHAPIRKGAKSSACRTFSRGSNSLSSKKRERLERNSCGFVLEERHHKHLQR